MLKDSIYKKALMLAIPMMIQSGIANMVVLVDNLMVGSLGTECITGVSVSAQILFVFNLAIFGGLSGPGIFGAQYFGHGDREGFIDVFRLKMWIVTFISLVGIVILFFGGPYLIQIYLTGEGNSFNPDMAVNYGLDYLNIMMIGLIPFAWTQVYAGSFREMNHSLEPMVAGLISVVADIILNYILIFGKVGMPALGVKGAAIATVLSRVIDLGVIAGWRKIGHYPYLNQAYDTLLVPIRRMKPIITKGIPIFINEFLWAAGVAALAQCYSRKGLAVVAGLNIANVLCNLFNVVFINLGAAAGILEGQFLGASDFEQARTSAMKLLRFNGAVCLGLTVILISLSGIFPGAYNTTADVKELARWFIIILAIFFPVQGVMNTLYFILRSGGKTVITFIFDSGFSWVVSVPTAYILCRFSPLSILAILTIVQAAEMLKVIFGYTLVKKGVWVTNLVE